MLLRELKANAITFPNDKTLDDEANAATDAYKHIVDVTTSLLI